MTARVDKPGRRSGRLEPVATLLDQLLPAMRLEERFAAAGATELWLEVIGPEVARRTRPVGVREGELLVEVRGSVWMGHLAILRQGIMEEINRRLPAEARIRAIKLTPMRGSDGTEAKPATTAGPTAQGGTT